MLIAPGSGARALSPNGSNGGVHLGDGDARDLAEQHPDAALLGKIRPDLLAIDMDGTDVHLEAVEDAAAAVGAVRVYLALSGSADSLHVIYAPPTVAARHALATAVRHLATKIGGGLTPRSAQEWLRLPGSPSLKAGGGPVMPVEPAGDTFAPLHPDNAWEAALQALEARKQDRAALGVPFTVDEFTTVLKDPDEGASSPSAGELVNPLSARTSRALDQEARRALALSCPRGEDATLHALRAAWHLWRCGYRTWEEVAEIVMRSPALSRWRRRGAREAARRWRMEAAKWESWRPELDKTAAGRLADAQASAAVLPPDLEAVLLAVLEWMGKAGRVDAVPVAVRDLVVWGVCGSVGSAHRALEALEVGGVLLRARRWEDGPAEEATLWTLQPPSLWQVPEAGADRAQVWNRHTHPPLGDLQLHPVWVELGHTSRRLLELAATSPNSSTSTLSTALGLGPSTVRRHLHRLEAAGLTRRSRSGRSTLWSASLDGWRSLPAVRAAEEAHNLRVQQMGAERATWRAGLEQARERSSTRDEEMLPGLLADTELWGDSGACRGEYSGGQTRGNRAGLRALPSMEPPPPRASQGWVARTEPCLHGSERKGPT